MFRREKLVHTRKEERGRGRGREGEIKVTYGEGKKTRWRSSPVEKSWRFALCELYP
jgi:hypothetical protein